MRNTDDISEEEFRERLERSRALYNEPYVKALKKIQTEMFSNPSCNAWKNNSEGVPTFGLNVKADEIDHPRPLQINR